MNGRICGAVLCGMCVVCGVVPGACAQLPPPREAQERMRTIEVDSAEALHEAFAEPLRDSIVRLAPGEYRLSARPYTDPTCGNCADPDQPAETTVGLHIRGQNVIISGPPDRSAVIHTGAGYGLLIEDASDVVVQHLSITGGTRSRDSNATDGAIVVRNSVATIRHNLIHNNLGDPEVVRQTVSGVIGIVGREGAQMIIERNEIVRNSWDGIALYRGAQAAIEQNVVDGVDKATGGTIGGGRGVGIGMTWDAEARVRGNLVRGYWKGIGAFVDADVRLEHNIVEDIVTWGISLWQAGAGTPRGVIRSNVVYRTGACGIAITSGTAQRPGELVGNVVVQSGQDERYDAPDRYCYQTALALHRVPEDFRIADNLYFDNRRGTEDLPDLDMPEGEFRRGLVPLLAVLGRYPSLQDSEFLAEYASAERVFLNNLAALEGKRFRGRVDDAHTPENPFEGEALVMQVEEVTRDGARIKLRVGEDRSRTWVLTMREGRLHLRHDHRDPDGTPHELTDYGGYAAPGGTAVRQSFPADEQTADLLPEAATNVWTLALRDGEFMYNLTRHGRPRFRAVFDLRNPLPAGDARGEEAERFEDVDVAGDVPGEAHARLEPLRGRWDAKIRIWPEPDGEPVHASGVARYHWVLADPDEELGRFLRQEFHSEMAEGGAPVRAIGYWGHDNARGQYVSVWMDSRSTGVFHGRGDHNAEMRTFTLTGTRHDADGREWSVRKVLTIVDADRHNFVSYWSSGQVAEYKAVEIEYTRAARDNGRMDRGGE